MERAPKSGEDCAAPPSLIATGSETLAKLTEASGSHRRLTPVTIPTKSPGAQGGKGRRFAGQGREVAAEAWRDSRGPTWPL